jgi:hypothetical protein
MRTGATRSTPTRAYRRERDHGQRQDDDVGHAGLLLRVSSIGQEAGCSLPDQERDGRAHCERMGYALAPHHVWNDGA